MNEILPAKLWNGFGDFIAPQADRFDILNSLIKKYGLGYRIAEIAGNRHFFISAPHPDEEYQRRRQTILTAHYDRYPGSPGANDNSAAVFILLDAAVKMMKEKIRSWMIIFTDKEELLDGEGITEQGAYSLASGLRETGFETARIYNFDACGTGEAMIISTTAELMLKNENSGKEKMRACIKDLRDHALETARNLRMDKTILMPTPFSDDAGFLRAGIAAQTITMLPSDECNSLISALRTDPDFGEALVYQELRKVRNQRLIPETWRIFNSQSDSYLRLTPRNFRIVQTFAESLCRQ